VEEARGFERVLASKKDVTTHPPFETWADSARGENAGDTFYL